MRRHVHLKKVLQGKTGCYLKVIKDKVLTHGDIFSSGILCCGVIILTEKTVSLEIIQTDFHRSICKYSYERIDQPCALRIIGQSWLEGLCAAAWADSQVASVWSSFYYLAVHFFAFPKIPKVPDQRDMVSWDDILNSTFSMGIHFRYSPKSVIVAILNNFLGYFKIDKHEIV